MPRVEQSDVAAFQFKISEEEENPVNYRTGSRCGGMLGYAKQRSATKNGFSLLEDRRGAEISVMMTQLRFLRYRIK